MKETKYTIHLLALTIVLGLVGFIFLNSKIISNEHPTQKEWLEVYLTHRIKTDWTDLWRQRISIRVVIFPEGKEIVVTLLSANGQEKISKPSKEVYVNTVEGEVRSVLKDHPWTKDFKLTVQYL